MKRKVRVKESKSVRRSVVLPRQLLAEAAGAAPKELHDNFNRLVRVALEEYIARREREAFKQSMERMARIPHCSVSRGPSSRVSSTPKAMGSPRDFARARLFRVARPHPRPRASPKAVGPRGFIRRDATACPWSSPSYPARMPGTSRRTTPRTCASTPAIPAFRWTRSSCASSSALSTPHAPWTRRRGSRPLSPRCRLRRCARSMLLSGSCWI